MTADSPAGWEARLNLSFERRGERTVLGASRRVGPLGVQRTFAPEGSACHCYLLHPPGGVVGGDLLDVGIAVAPGAHALVTTPGATKVYRSAGPQSRLCQRLEVAAGAVLEWLPQANILFPGAHAKLETQVTLHGDASFIGWEIHVLGRPSVRERFEIGRVELSLAVNRDGRPLLLDRLRVTGVDDLGGLAGLRGFPVTAALVAGPAGDGDVCVARAALARSPDAPAGVSLVDGLLVARCLGSALEPVTQRLVAVWSALRQRLLGRAPCPPRIWAT